MTKKGGLVPNVRTENKTVENLFFFIKIKIVNIKNAKKSFSK